MSVADEVEERVTREYMDMCSEFDINPTLAKIYMSLFFAEKPIGLDELVEKTGYGKSTICKSMGLIEHLMDVGRFKKPGSKKIYFECHHDTNEILHKIMVAVKEREVRVMIKLLKESEEKLKKEDTEKAKTYTEYISKLRKDYEKCNKVLGLIDKLHI